MTQCDIYEKITASLTCEELSRKIETDTSLNNAAEIIREFVALNPNQAQVEKAIQMTEKYELEIAVNKILDIAYLIFNS